MTIDIDVPQNFQPGAPLNGTDARNLVHAGFESGYPLYSLTSFDPMWMIRTLSGPHVFDHLAGKPKLVVQALLAGAIPLGDEEKSCSRVRRMPLRIRSMQLNWSRELDSILIEGDLEKENRDETWMVDGKKVYGALVRVALLGELDSSSVPGYIQVIPMGHQDKPLPPSGEGFIWASSLPIIE